MKYTNLIIGFFLLFLLLNCAKDTASIVQTEVSSSSIIGITPSDLGSISDTITYYEALLAEEDNPTNQQLLIQIIEDNKTELKAQSTVYIEQQKLAVTEAESALEELKESGASEVEIIAAEEAVAEAKGALILAENEYGDPVINEELHLMVATELEETKDSIDMFEQLSLDIPENGEAYGKVITRLKTKLEQQSLEYVQQRDSVVKVIEAEVQSLQGSDASDADIAVAQERLATAQGFKDAAERLVVGLVPDIELPIDSSQEVNVSSSSVLKISSSQSIVSSSEIIAESSVGMMSSIVMVSSSSISSALELSSVIQISSVVSSSSSVNRAPTFSQADTLIKVIAEDSTLTVSLNASDADGDVLTWVLDSAANGSATIDAGGNDRSVTYVPKLNYNGTDRITILVSDGSLDTEVVINITMTAVDDSVVYSGTPTLNDSTKVGLALIINEGDCTDPDEAEIFAYEWYRDVDGSGDDGVLIVGQSAKTYTLTNADAGKFIYAKITCSGSVSKVTPHSNEISAAPIISPDAVEIGAFILEDDNGSGFSIGAITAVDSNTSDSLIWSIVSAALHGAATTTFLDAVPTIGYTPSSDFFGTDTFTLRVYDGELADQIDIIVTVTGVNDDPEYGATPTITGIEKVNETLAVDPVGSCIDVDAVSGLGTFSYVWSRYDNVSGGGQATIGTNASTYVLTGAEEGKYIKVAVTCTGLHGTAVTTSTIYSGLIGAAAIVININEFEHDVTYPMNTSITAAGAGNPAFSMQGWDNVNHVGSLSIFYGHMPGASDSAVVTMGTPNLTGMSRILINCSANAPETDWFIKLYDTNDSQWKEAAITGIGSSYSTIAIDISSFNGAAITAANIDSLQIKAYDPPTGLAEIRIEYIRADNQ